MKFLMTLNVKNPVTGELEPLVSHTIDFDEQVTTIQAAVALVEAEKEIIYEYVRCSIEEIQA